MQMPTYDQIRYLATLKEIKFMGIRVNDDGDIISFFDQFTQNEMVLLNI